MAQKSSKTQFWPQNGYKDQLNDFPVTIYQDSFRWHPYLIIKIGQRLRKKRVYVKKPLTVRIDLILVSIKV